MIWLRQARIQVPVQSMRKPWGLWREESKCWRQITAHLVCDFPHMYYSENHISLPFFPTTLFFPNSKSFSAFVQISLQHVFGLDPVYLARAWYSPEILYCLLLFPTPKILYFLHLSSSVLFKIQFKFFLFFSKYYLKFPWTRFVSFLFSNNF